MREKKENLLDFEPFFLIFIATHFHKGVKLTIEFFLYIVKVIEVNVL